MRAVAGGAGQVQQRCRRLIPTHGGSGRSPASEPGWSALIRHVGISDARSGASRLARSPVGSPYLRDLPQDMPYSTSCLDGAAGGRNGGR